MREAQALARFNAAPVMWAAPPPANSTPTFTLADMQDVGASAYGAFNASFDGDKFFGGFGETKVMTADYWTLRTRSVQLFTENLYAKGLIRRLVTNEINTGLTLEAVPDANILGLTDEAANDWSEIVEGRFRVWSADARLCDYSRLENFAALEESVRIGSLIAGDMLVILHINPATGLPNVQLVDGANVMTPLNPPTLAKGHRLVNGVELDAAGRHVAFYVKNATGPFGTEFITKRVPARGSRSGRRLAWLVYGTEKRVGEVRGIPFLALMLQSMRELDRYRDSEQRAAVVNSLLAMFIKKDGDKPGTVPVSGGAVRRDSVVTTDGDGTARTYQMAEQIPGVVFEELQQGETPESFDTRRPNVNYGAFEDAMVSTMAWCSEVPPEILRLGFKNNYSASKAAINEFELYLDKSRGKRSTAFNQLIYEEWLISETLRGKIIAPRLLASRHDPKQYDVFGAWLLTEWTGAVKPGLDLKKDVGAYTDAIDAGLTTHELAAKKLFGRKFSNIVRRLRQENQLLVDAQAPLREAEAAATVAAGPTAEVIDIDTLAMAVADEIEARSA